MQRGATLVEVLVTMVILAIGLLGLIGLHGRVQLLQMESYQRAQALMLLNDMANRIANNRYDAAAYITAPTNPLGTEVAGGCPVPAPGASRQEIDAAQWCEALVGAGELSDAGDSVGAMIGGRGCVANIGGGDYLVTVAWQGLAPIAAPPPDDVPCGLDEYDGTGDSSCVDNLCRRVVTTVVRIPELDL